MNDNQELIDQVIEQMKSEIAAGDWAWIEGLLAVVAVQALKGYLPELSEETV
jgi:hypothetical protein|tara:strand:+ start:45 stop:200 length:156 start_codon:yes stop_codon:yes gene_type:complete